MTFEWSFITGRRSFHWPLVSKSTILKHSQKQLILKLTGWVRWRPSMLCVLNLCWVFYFLCRYCMLFSFIGLWVKPGPLLRGAFWLSTTRIISLAVTTQVSARSSSLYTNSWGAKINCRVGIVCHKTRSCSTCAFPILGLIHFQLSKWHCISLCSHLSHASYQWAGNMTIGCASTSLMLRTWVLLLQLYLNHQSNGDWWTNL